MTCLKLINPSTILNLTLVLFLVMVLGCETSEEKEELTLDELKTAEKILSFLNLAQEALDEGRYNVALSQIDSAEIYGRYLAGVHYFRGLILDQLNRFQDSEIAYSEALRINPSFHGAWFNMGNNALGLDQFNKALKNYTNELKEYPRAEVYEKIAVTHANLYESEKAMENVLKAVSLDSLYAPAYFLLGRINRDEGKIEDALINLRKANKLDPENHEYIYELGALLLRSGSVDESINYLYSAHQNMKWHYGSHYNLGQALVRIGRESEGRKLLVRADSLQELESLTARYLQRTRERPENQNDWGNLANVFRRMGRLNEASQAYKVALSLGPNDLELRNTVAYLSLVTGDTTGALWHYRRLLEQDHTRADTWFNLGIIQVSRGEFGSARRSWENVLRLDPGDSTTSQFLRKLPKSTFLEILE